MRNWKRGKNKNTEQVLQRQICDWITRNGGYVRMYKAMHGGKQADGSWKTYRSHYMPPGVPDLIVCWKGQFVGIEVKRPKDTQATLLGAKPRPAGRLSDHQKRELDAIRRAMGKSLVAYSLEDVIQALAPNQSKQGKEESHDESKNEESSEGWSIEGESQEQEQSEEEVS